MNKFLAIGLWSAGCLLVLAAGGRSDTVATLGGETLKGRITSESAEEVTIKPDGRAQKKIPRSQVRSISYGATAELRGAVITTHGGRTFRGVVQEENKDYLFLKMTGEPDKVVYRSEIASLEYVAVDQAAKPNFKTSYPVVGLTMLNPALANLNLGYYFEKWGVRATGGYWGNSASGGDLHLVYKVSESLDVLHAVTLFGGSSHLIASGASASDTDLSRERYWNYGGLSYELNYKGWFLEIGLADGSGSYHSPQVLMQLGYVCRVM